jgi:plasmid stability protein
MLDRWVYLQYIPLWFYFGTTQKGGDGMATITVKSIPDELYERLKQRAEAHRRSINSEIIVCLEQYLCARNIDPDEFLARADMLRERAELPPINEKMLREVKSAGRP